MALSKQLAIDLGTANCLVWEIGKGLVINEPTVVAVTLEERKVLAVGKEAKEMLGRTPEYIEVARPMREGVIADYQVTESMLRWFIRQTGTGILSFFKPEVMVCVPTGVTQVEQRAVLDAALSAGARVAYLIDSPLAAAIGAGIPISLAAGNMIVDIGGGACEAAVIALGGVVVHKSVRVAGNKLDEAIINWLKKNHNIVVGDQTAEQIKIEIGTALPSKSKEKKMAIRGRDSVSGLPRKVDLASVQVNEAINEPLAEILSAVRGVLEKTPPELVADIVDKGIILSGGTALLNNLDKFLTRQIGVSFHVAQEPLLCTVKGTAIALENLEEYKSSLRF
ncbi:MAG: rod shape-determining protein [Candidatus Shapirobacteria bacterium]